MRWPSALLCVALSVITSQAWAQPLDPTDQKAEADIFASGALTSAGNAETIYTWDVKFNYPKLERPLDKGARHWLLFSPKVEFVANKGTNANPDRIAAAGVAEILFDTAEATSSVLSRLAWVNSVGAEFDRDRTTKTFAVQSFGRLMFKTFAPIGPPGKFGFAPWVDAGFETGNNFENKIQDEGSGAIARAYFGVNVLQRLGHANVAVTLIYEGRKPFRDEVFFRKSDTETQLRLSDEMRHYTEVALVMSVAKFLSIKPTYKRGTLPPAFNYLDNEFSLALQFGAKARLKKDS